MVCMVKDLCGSRWFALWCAVLSVVLIVRVHCACLLQLNCRLDVHDNNREQKKIYHSIECNNGTGNFYRKASTSQRVIVSI